MPSRKIFNYESKILHDLTMKNEGYSPDSLGNSSSKFIYATCRFCGNPSRIRKGFFLKSGSACHKECRLKEQSLAGSPFADEKVRKKSEQTNIKKYGHKSASSSQEIKTKISNTKRSEINRQKAQETVLSKYGVANVSQSDEIKNKIRQSNIKKYGFPYSMQNSDVSEKYMKTSLQKYGVTNPAKSYIVKTKTKHTNISRYGHEYPMQNQDVHDAAKDSSLQKYGTEYPAQSKSVRSTIAGTNRVRYGSDSPFSSDVVRDKAKQSFYEKYGVDNPFKSEIIRNNIEKLFINKYGSKCPLNDNYVFNKSQETMINRYGVPCVFQDSNTQDSIKNTNMSKYDVEYPLQNSNIYKKYRHTFKEKYGVVHPSLYPEFVEKQKDSMKRTVEENANGNYDVINTLRYNDDFWRDMESMSIKSLCKKYNLHYPSVSTSLLLPEFREKYYRTYCFPKHQTQNEICNYFRNLGFNVIINDRSVIYPLELDIYFPDYNFAIEYNGSYWHSEAVLSSSEAKKKHVKKTKKCRENNIRLLHIFQNNWQMYPEKYISYISNILGINNKKIYARKCYVTYDNHKDFIDKYHLQGYGWRTLKFFNLVYNNEVVASMTASKHHRQNVEGKCIVLNRFCSKSYCSVLGGATKLFSNFKKWASENGFSRILSWSDSSWTDGKIYEILGFNLDIEYKPDYFYWDIKNDCYRSKQSQRKNSVNCPKGWTEREWAMHRGLYRIWDCGKKKWVCDL